MRTTNVAGRTWHCHALGRRNSVGKGFSIPTAVAVAPGGILYVLSRGVETPFGVFGERVGKLTIDEEFLGDFGGGALNVFGGGEFIWLAGLAVDNDGNVYFSDEYRNLICAYDPDGQQLGRWGETGSEEGQLNGPSGLAFDREDNIYVVDSLNDRVQKLTKDGQFLLSWGSSGSGEGQLNRPWGITIDQNGEVYVADWGNNRVQKFSPDGKFLMAFGPSAGEGGGLNHPADVAVDSEGDVYVTDWGNNRVQVYDRTGDIVTAFYGDATEFSGWAKELLEVSPAMVKALHRVDDLTPLARFHHPRGIAVDEQDRVVITDSIRGRLQVYAKDKDYMGPQFNL